MCIWLAALLRPINDGLFFLLVFPTKRWGGRKGVVVADALKSSEGRVAEFVEFLLSADKLMTIHSIYPVFCVELNLWGEYMFCITLSLRLYFLSVLSCFRTLLRLLSLPPVCFLSALHSVILSPHPSVTCFCKKERTRLLDRVIARHICLRADYSLFFPISL